MSSINRRLNIKKCEIEPRLYIVIVKTDVGQREIKKVGIGLHKVITTSFINGRYCTIHDYVHHIEMTVYEINSLFKDFN